MFCTTCGKQLPDNATVCDGCGTPIKKKSAKAKVAESEGINNAAAGPSAPPQYDGSQPAYSYGGQEPAAPQKLESNKYKTIAFISAGFTALIALLSFIAIIIICIHFKGRGGMFYSLAIVYGGTAIINHYIFKACSSKTDFASSKKMFFWFDAGAFMFLALTIFLTVIYYIVWAV